VGGLPNWVSHAYAVSCLVQTILLTAALGVRLRAAEAMNRVMGEEALLSAQRAEQRAIDLVEEKTRELSVAKQVAEDALRAELASQEQQVRFMEVISHQYRTPLAAVRSHVDNIGLSLPADDAANRARLDRVRRGIVRLVEVLEVNLTRSRLQGSAFQPRLLRSSLGEIVAAAGLRGRDLLQPGIVTQITPEAAEARILADADMLGIAIINLLENAVKFSTQTSADPIMLSCAVAGSDGVIRVNDKGIGIPAQDIAGILGRSVRGSNAGGIAGSGMGLSLVARIAAAHGGRVEIDSTVGQGTTVTILVPLALV
jgi:signal transduction histidine kinase